MVRKLLSLFLCFLFLFSPFNLGWTQDLAKLQDESEPLSIELQSENSDVMSEIVSFDYKDAELDSVLRAIATSYDLNIIPMQEIKGKINVSLKSITLEEALEAMLLSKGYAYTRKGNIMYVTSHPDAAAFDMISASFHLESITAAEAENLIGKAISSKGDIRINSSTNSLVVTDYSQQIDRVRELLGEIDIAPIQVLIEAKIVDITSSDLEAIGVTYGGTYTNQGLLHDRSDSYQHLDSVGGTVTMNEQSSSLTGGQFNLSSFGLKNLDATATIDALIRDQRANILASPSIATLNGKEARIIIGEKYPYTEQTQTTTGTTETTKFVDIGTTLRVTPQVSPNGWITMTVHPEVSSVSEALAAGPRITTREADTTVRVKDGDTIVIGGLLKKTDDRVIDRIPILGYIPIIGFLFSRRSKDVINKELAVFITPHIIKSGNERRVASIDGKEEVYVNIEGTGQRVMVNTLFEQARNLELSQGIESVRKDTETRMAEAIDMYNHISSQFPDSEKADDALFKSAMLYYKHFKNYEMSRKMFSKIAGEYSRSPYVHKSNKMIVHLDKIIAKRNK